MPIRLCRALYVAPVMPRPSGNGLAMRAAAMLAALAQRFDVHLLVVGVGGDTGPVTPFVRRHAARIQSLDLERYLDPHFSLIARLLDPEERARTLIDYPKPFMSRFCTGDTAAAVAECCADQAIEVVHVMRLYLAPLAQSLLRQPSRPFCVLDLDDDDVTTFERIAALYARRGDDGAAAAASAEARKYAALAEAYFPAFDRILVGSNGDARRLGDGLPADRVAVVPNVYPGTRAPRQRLASGSGPLRLLFVGTLGYAPNVDAAWFLCRQVLPALRRIADRPVAIDLVGSGDAAALDKLARDPTVTLHGFVRDLAPLYAAADIAVSPVRAGGGTRIKILEAFAYGVPVVATPLAAEGIEAVDGEHLLLADTAQSFARACVKLMADRQMADEMAQKAWMLLSSRYSPRQMAAAIGEAYSPFLLARLSR